MTDYWLLASGMWAEVMYTTLRLGPYKTSQSVASLFPSTAWGVHVLDLHQTLCEEEIELLLC